MNWGLEGVGFWPILAPLLLLFSKGNDPKCTTQQPPSGFNPILLQWCSFITRAPKHQKSCDWCSDWSGVDIWLWKVGFTLWPIRHGPPDGALSSSSAVKSLQAGLPSNTKLEKAPSGGPCPGSMPKPYPFWASDNPLWYFLLSYGACQSLQFASVKCKMCTKPYLYEYQLACSCMPALCSKHLQLAAHPKSICINMSKPMSKPLRCLHDSWTVGKLP